MYLRTKVKIDKLDGDVHSMINDLYEALSLYELNKSNLDDVIVKLWELFYESGSGRFDEYKVSITVIFIEILKFFTKKKKGLFDKYLLYEDHDKEMVEGYMCEMHLLKYVEYDDLEMLLAIYRVYRYFRSKRCI
jgi:hypothetical protein